MSWRDPAWLQRGLDAMKATLDVDPQLMLQMVQFLLDEGFWDKAKLTPAAARARFYACLNPGKAEFFKLSELWVLMKRFHRYELWLAMGDDLGFERPKRLPTLAHRDHLQQQLDAQERVRLELLAELEAIDAANLVEPATPAPDNVRIHPAMREPGPRWSQADDEGGF